HGKMDAETRRRNQEQGTNGEAPAMVGKLGFGVGINKKSVGAGIHLPLTKSIEKVYNEAGSARHDGPAADCLMLWRKKDTALLALFINQIEDEAEKARAWRRWREITGFVQSEGCRHREICEHFGETPKWQRCETCDQCGKVPEWMTAPE